MAKKEKSRYYKNQTYELILWDSWRYLRYILKVKSILVNCILISSNNCPSRIGSPKAIVSLPNLSSKPISIPPDREYPHSAPLSTQNYAFQSQPI